MPLIISPQNDFASRAEMSRYNYGLYKFYYITQATGEARMK